MGIENAESEEILRGIVGRIDSESSEAMKVDDIALPILIDSERLREIAAPLFGQPFGALMDEAQARWPGVTRKMRVPEVEAVAIGPLAKTIGSSWPTTRFTDPLKVFLGVNNPNQLLRLRGIGKRKARTLVVLILSLETLLGSGDSPEEGEREFQLPADPVDRVTLMWSKISESILGSPISEERIYDLARRWGVDWPASTKVHHTLGEVLRAQSLRDFITRARSMGKRKIEPLSAIIWRAWQEVDPDGPAGPPKSESDWAQEEYERLAGESGALAVVKRAIELAKVSNREESVLERRHGLGQSAPMTLEEVGAQDNVTRERIRQIQVMAENRIRDNQASRELLQLTLEKELSNLLHSLELRCGSPLLGLGRDLHRALTPTHSFLVELLHDGVYLFLDHLVGVGRIQKTPVGWWLGEELPDGAGAMVQSATILLQEAGRPLPLQVIADGVGVDSTIMRPTLVSSGLTVEMGYVFLGKLSAPQKRCLFALEIAATSGKWLWAEVDFYKAAIALDQERAGSLRLLLRDTECIPGVGIDIPGPYVLVNPLAVQNAGAHSVDDSDAELDSNQEVEVEPVEQDSAAWDAVGVDTLAGQVQQLLEGIRIAKFEELEEKFCEAAIGSPGSLGPTLLSRPQFVRYAPGYWGLAGLNLEEPEIEQLCTSANLIAYVRSRSLGGLDELFPFWNPEMEYHWCRWAERFAAEDLYHSLLAICEPRKWNVSEPIRAQWESKKKRFGIDRLPPVQPSLDMAYIGFEEIYGLVHLVHQRGSIGPITIPHFYGLRAADRKSYGTMALLAALGILTPRPDMESPWESGNRVEGWLETMSRLHFFDPPSASDHWRVLLEDTVQGLDSSEDFGWFSGGELKESFNRWKTERDSP